MKTIITTAVAVLLTVVLFIGCSEDPTREGIEFEDEPLVTEPMGEVPAGADPVPADPVPADPTTTDPTITDTAMTDTTMTDPVAAPGDR
jgi:hypothetical protein